MVLKWILCELLTTDNRPRLSVEFCQNCLNITFSIAIKYLISEVFRTSVALIAFFKKIFKSMYTKLQLGFFFLLKDKFEDSQPTLYYYSAVVYSNDQLYFSPGNMKKNKIKLVENQQTCLLSL